MRHQMVNSRVAVWQAAIELLHWRRRQQAVPKSWADDLLRQLLGGQLLGGSGNVATNAKIIISM